ncbi:TonB-dependent receptor [Rhizorhabdus wittichii DC-6]|nr:TonB-dependent receptor [Rhizorhabdus wittichii DC-6]
MADRSNRVAIIALALSGAAFFGGMPAVAATADAGVQAEPEGADIIVTARRREETLQSVPIAVSAISAATLERRQIDSVAQVGEAIPNMTYQTGAPTGTGASTPSVFIRGIGSAETSLGTEPGVGLYVDDVYIARSVGSVLDLVSVDSVQVLRGPQGTLFGRNSLGGAILIRSRRPADRLSGSVELKTGRYDRADIRASLDVPLSDTLRTSLSGMRERRDGYVRNLDGDKANGNIHREAARFVAEWQASDTLKIDVNADLTRIRESAPPSVLLGLVPTIPGTPVPSSIQEISNLQAGCFGGSVLADSGNPRCIDQGAILGPFRTLGGYSTDNAIFDSQGSRPFGNASRIDIRGVSGRLEWTLSPELSFKSITAYRTLDAFWTSNSDHTPNPGIETKNDQDQKQFTQEFQLLGKTGSLDWVLGAFYMHETGDALNVVAFPQVIFRSGGGFKTDAIAGFAQGTYRITPALNLTLGLRYTDERKKYDTLANQQIIGVIADPVSRTFVDLRATPIPFVTGSTPNLAFTEFTPHANLSYDWSSDLMTYVSYSRGYKSGGYEQRLAPGTPTIPSFRPEYVDSYEAGLKATAFDRRLTISAAAFHAKYKDLQISVVDGPAPTLTNGGDATLNGAELELGWRPVRGVTLTGFASYLDAGYDRLTPRAIVSGIRLGSRLPSTSRWQFGGSAGFDVPLTGSLSLRPNVDWSYRSAQYLDSANERLLRQKGYTLVNGALTLASTAGWSISLSGRNLLDRTYLVSGLAQYNIGEIEGQYARPREWALGFKYQF